jgi:hypothetical protein
MPRYLIVTRFEIDEEAMPDVGRHSKEIRSGGVPRSPRRGRRGQRDKRADLPTRWSHEMEYSAPDFPCHLAGKEAWRDGDD